MLIHDVTGPDLKAGDVGSVVHCYEDEDGVGFEVEFLNAEGKTVGLLILTTADIRPIDHSEIFHVQTAYGIAPSKREELQKHVIAQYGEKLELIAPKDMTKKRTKKKKTRGNKRKKR